MAATTLNSQILPLPIFFPYQRHCQRHITTSLRFGKKLCSSRSGGKIIPTDSEPIRRDTTLLPPNGHLVMQFTTDNPGIWPVPGVRGMSSIRLIVAYIWRWSESADEMAFEFLLAFFDMGLPSLKRSLKFFLIVVSLQLLGLRIVHT